MEDDLNFKIKMTGNDTVPSSTLIRNEGGPSVTHEGNPQQSKAAGFCSIFSIEFYRPYFDFTTQEIQRRVIASIDPRKDDFFEVVNGRPDLYGPFWILTTLVFVVAASANLAGYVLAHQTSQQYESHFEFVPSAASLIYGFGIGVPIIFACILKYLGSSEVKVLDVWADYLINFKAVCIYAYSLFVLIPVLILAIIPSTLIQWLVLMYGMGNSTLFLLNNYSAELKKYVGNQRYLLLGFIGAAQVILLLIFKTQFFDFVYGSSNTEA